jgi:hypothetical protein
MHPSVALAQEGGVVLQSLGPKDRALHSFSVEGEKISSAEFLEGWRAKN